jgi:hypothetical protein
VYGCVCMRGGVPPGLEEEGDIGMGVCLCTCESVHDN